MEAESTGVGLVVLAAVFIAACSNTGMNRTNMENNANTVSNTVSQVDESPTADSNNKKTDKDAAIGPPENVRQFFMLLTAEFFAVEGCDTSVDRYCKNAKNAYLSKYLTIEDSEYLQTGGDGALTAFKMRIFRRPDNSFLVGLSVLGETSESYKFLNISGGKWEDVSIEAIPEFSNTNIYEIPRKGTMVPVYTKRIIEQRENFEVSDKGEKIYDLEWNEGEFLIKR